MTLASRCMTPGSALRLQIIQVNLWYSMVSVSAVAATLPPAFYGM